MSQKLTIPETLYRSATFEREAINEEERTVELSISSEAPYRRWFGNEILDHKPECVNMGRMGSSAPLLFNHDRSAHLGRIVSARLENGKLMVKAKFGNSALANEKWQDVKDGILKETSVGYQVSKMVLEEEKEDGDNTYRVTEWTPYEGSLVTVPADPSVGVGRQRELEIFLKDEKTLAPDSHSCEKPTTSTTERTMSEPTNTPKAPEKAPEIDLNTARNAAIAEYKERCKKIDQFVDTLRIPEWKESAKGIATKHKNGDADFDEFRTEFFQSTEGFREVKTGDADLGLSEKEVKRFSFLGAIRQMATDRKLSGFEKEVSEATRAQLDKQGIPQMSANSFVVPNEILRSHTGEYLQHQRAQTVAPATAGGFLVQNQYGPLIEFLRNKTALGQAGITMLDGLQGDTVLPVQTSGATAYWVSETGSITTSSAAFGQKTLTPHRLGANIVVSLKLYKQSAISVDAWLQNEFNTVLALKKDAGGLFGTGAAGEPEGLMNADNTNATVTYSAAAVWADVVEHETGIATDNADIGSMAFILSTAAVGKWKTALKDAVAGAGYLIDDNMRANGYPVIRTNQITSAAATGGNRSFFGVWNQLIMGMWGSREFVVDPYGTNATGGTVSVTANEFCDFMVRQPAAFNISTDSAAQ